MTRLPVGFQSLVIQCMALLLAALLNLLLQTPFSYQPALWQLALVQGAIAAGLSFLWRQPAWWPPLRVGFLPAILLALQVNVPAWIYLAAFLLLVLFYWSSFRTRVPLYLSSKWGVWNRSCSSRCRPNSINANSVATSFFVHLCRPISPMPSTSHGFCASIQSVRRRCCPPMIRSKRPKSAPIA